MADSIIGAVSGKDIKIYMSVAKYRLIYYSTNLRTTRYAGALVWSNTCYPQLYQKWSKPNYLDNLT